MGKKGAARKYNRQAVMAHILKEMSKGDRCLEAIIEQDEGMPEITAIYNWIGGDTEEALGLSNIFLRAQELWCRAQVRKMIEIADDESRDIILDSKGNQRSDNTAVNRDRNRIMARQWAMSKLAPKIFGDRIEQQITGKDGAALQVIINVNTKQQGQIGATPKQITHESEE